ncbi:ASCH domain-containing protein [Citricoccus sp.]|uniref:ASCH domain-containing protein n=1 Tax=Citricoccus sp. TaxID=1978372 RepID=UPI0028BF2775|nr:ASCH domain-containing protein [Citricoccus sp.]
MSIPLDSAHTDFWRRTREAVPSLPPDLPEAWAFGATPDHADALLALVLDGTKTGTASSGWDYEATGEPIPAAGEFSIILDGGGRPRAVIETTDVRVVPFGEVDAAHARAEGEGDLSLAAWRAIHERYWRSHSGNPRGWAPDMPVICERFRLVYSDKPAQENSAMP